MSQNLPDKQKGQTPQGALQEAFKADLEKITPYLEAILPHKGQVVRFKQMTMVAILRNQDLLKCTRRSLLLSLLWCAQKDLEPGVDDGCWILPYKSRGELTATPVAAYKGLIKKAEETGSVKDVQAYDVCENDEFECGLGLDPYLKHSLPKLGVERGKLIGAYVVITKPDGSKRFLVMDRKAIEKIRASSASWRSGGDSPWKNWEEAMFLKTVIKQGFKQVPVKPAFRDLIQEDGRIEAGESLALLLKEARPDEGLPEGLEGDGQAPPPEPESLDTSAFDKLVEEKLKVIATAEAYQQKSQRVSGFIEATAAAQKKARMTPDQVKVKAAENFTGFWSAFEKWEEKTFPPTTGAALASAPGAAPGDPAIPPEHNPEEDFAASPVTDKSAAAPGDECPFPPAGTGPGGAPNPDSPPVGAVGAVPDPSFPAKRIALWDRIIDEGIPLADLADSQYCGITALEQITPENYGKVEWFVKNWKTMKKGKGKGARK